jgi:phosphoglycerate kinase
MNKQTIADVEITGKRVLIRADLNVPLESGKVSDDPRIVAGGGASLEFLEGKKLPRVACLNAQNVGAVMEDIQPCGLAESMRQKFSH